MRTHRNILLASGLTAALTLGVAGVAAAAPAGPAGTVVKEAADASVLLVAERSRRVKRRTRHHYPPAAAARGYGQPGPGYYAPGLGYDNVGSIVHDGIGYGYNRRTGERYMSCQIDEGYGRVTPCDAGNGGGGGLN